MGDSFVYCVSLLYFEITKATEQKHEFRPRNVDICGKDRCSELVVLRSMSDVDNLNQVPNAKITCPAGNVALISATSEAVFGE
jgi:hypothetical protein